MNGGDMDDNEKMMAMISGIKTGLTKPGGLKNTKIL
jgi:hypothetical protein